MAQRRMFNRSIVNSSKFLKMPMSSRLLYYDLGMNADDDGYAEHFMVMRITGASQQDLGVLEINGFVKVFDDNVLIISDWKENNYIQKDRYTPSKYLSVYNMDTKCIQDVYTGKVSIGKISIDKDSIDNIQKEKKVKYGEYKHVLLTDAELQSLKSSYDNYLELIKYLDEYIEMKGYKAKSHYLCIKKWVVDAVSKNKPKSNSKEIEEWLNE